MVHSVMSSDGKDQIVSASDDCTTLQVAMLERMIPSP